MGSDIVWTKLALGWWVDVCNQWLIGCLYLFICSSTCWVISTIFLRLSLLGDTVKGKINKKAGVYRWRRDRVDETKTKWDIRKVKRLKRKQLMQYNLVMLILFILSVYFVKIGGSMATFLALVFLYYGLLLRILFTLL